MLASIVQPQPRVGIGVIIRREERVALGLRNSSHGNGTWAFPGGHLEFGESFADCAIRETVEEVGPEIVISEPRLVFVNNVLHKSEGKHYVTIYLEADWLDGEISNMEPEKCHRWQWFTWEELPYPLFLGLDELIASGYHPFRPNGLHLNGNQQTIERLIELARVMPNSDLGVLATYAEQLTLERKITHENWRQFTR